MFKRLNISILRKISGVDPIFFFIVFSSKLSLQGVCGGKLHIYVDKRFFKKITLIKKIVGVHDVR